MLHVIVFCASLLLSAHAADITEPAKCCVDRQFTVMVAALSGTYYPITGNAEVEDSYTYVAYDFYSKKVGYEYHLKVPGGNETVTRSIMDYTGGKIYTQLQDGNCYITDLKEQMEEPCVPADATYLGESTIGYGKESLIVKTWEYVEPGTDVMRRRTFTKDGCVPFASGYYGTVDKTPKNGVEFFTGYKPGIADDTIFDTAMKLSTCKAVYNPDGTKVTDAPMVGR